VRDNWSCATLALVLAGCVAPQKDTSPPPQAPAVLTSHRDSSVERLPAGDSAAIVYYNFLAVAAANHGAFLDSAVDTVRNEINPVQLDSLFTYRYANVTMRYLHFPGANVAPMFVGGSLDSFAAGRPFGIGVGSTADSVVARLGRPQRDTTANGIRELYYEVGTNEDPTTSNLYFQIQGGRVLKVLWAPYVD
jgi:hypothetical protein